MSKKSKAYQAAAELLAEVQDYPNLDGPIRDQWLQQRIQFNTPAWDIIWKAARRAEWENCQDDIDPLQTQITQLMLRLEESQSRLDVCRSNLDGAVETAKKRLERIHYLEKELKYATGQLVDRNKELADALEAAKTARSFTSSAQRRSIKLLRSNQALRDENFKLKGQVVEATALTTEGTRTLQERFDKLQEKYQRGERLYEQVEKENNYNKNALDLTEEELVRLREQLAQERTAGQTELDALRVDVNYFRAMLKACTERREELLTRALEAEQKLAAVPEVAHRKPEGDGWHLSWTKFTGQYMTGTMTPVTSAPTPAPMSPSGPAEPL